MGRWVTVVLGELGVARTKVAAGAKNNWEVSLRSVASTKLGGGGGATRGLPISRWTTPRPGLHKALGMGGSFWRGLQTLITAPSG